ncbi:hypothetical protein P153DRAFT_27297 [Dothidotthia symphoricarpi CBS 119687]|uniref:FAD-binding FR-type domain-containing protein n=1 Tax=Dothidotthia symphoricarpi CBS 119687 TaxID=1392245 RepID=A0A6A6ABB2_9PLEO|nr:uncharacterized protein P153DRAFT_27297 [Dothidotthia symphoricarpi CBS 119687]KAF2128866.1 hypothetical protein P153DRAFT_27297 [Dothidotthia symphoricarpi CBS 119687]
MSWLRRRSGPLIILGTSALGGTVYRILKPSNSGNESLNPYTFTPYTLVDKQPVSSTSAIFTLRHRHGAPEPESVREAWKRSTWSVQIKQPQLQIARAYTPLPPTSDGEGKDEDMRLLIRQETGGELSTYLHRLPEQSTIELRGPNTEFELPDGINEVLFLAGGTGIAPAMQVAYILEGRPESTMRILWANRRREECVGGVSDGAGSITSKSGWKGFFGSSDSTAQQPLSDTNNGQEKGIMVKELDTLKARSKAATRDLSVQYFVDEEKSVIRSGDVAKMIHESPGEKGSRVIMVSGPDGFVEYWAGRKLWVDGREAQGPLRGVLGKMNLKDWKVIKL